MEFPESIRKTYRIVTTKYGNGESEESLPLGSWRKGSGLAGKRGHVYVKGPKEAGVWLISKRWPTMFADIQTLYPSVKLLQAGSDEMTFSVSWADLEDLLPFLNAKRLPVMSPAQLERNRKGRANSPLMNRTQPEGVKNAPLNWDGAT